MLKRYQILLNDWMADHYKAVAKTYDVSFSEMVRMAMCADILHATRVAFPKYRSKIRESLLQNVIKERNIVKAMGRERFYRFLSEIYFEAHKATELWNQGEKIASLKEKR